MRWPNRTPVLGAIRLRARFLWFPKTLRLFDLDQPETRWLERGVWYEEYICTTTAVPYGYTYDTYWWRPYRWAPG